jgi:uncharacterized Zn-binding protein involved in type VI secretion
MPTGPAARLGDPTAHGSPLAGAPGCPTVLIGGQPAWRGTSAAAAANLASKAAEGAAKLAKAAAAATAGAATPAGPALQAKLVETAVSLVADMASLMASMPGDLHACPIVKVLIPDGPGMVMNPSQTVMIGGMGAARLGDMIQEATSVNSVAMGCPTVIIGG